MQNLPLNIAENAEIGNKISSTTQSAKNLLVLMNMAKNAEVGSGKGSDNKTLKPTYAKH